MCSRTKGQGMLYKQSILVLPPGKGNAFDSTRVWCNSRGALPVVPSVASHTTDRQPHQPMLNRFHNRTELPDLGALPDEPLTKRLGAGLGLGEGSGGSRRASSTLGGSPAFLRLLVRASPRLAHPAHLYRLGHFPCHEECRFWRDVGLGRRRKGGGVVGGVVGNSTYSQPLCSPGVFPRRLTPLPSRSRAASLLPCAALLGCL